MKSQRQARILELIEKCEIETQEEMMSLLISEGFKVTQATVSRDLKELKLTKTLTARGTYRYAVGQTKYHGAAIKLGNSMADSIISVEYAFNNVVIKTYPGLAQAVAFAVDSLELSGVLGCVAGDDTIIIVTRSEENSLDICEHIKELVKSF